MHAASPVGHGGTATGQARSALGTTPHCRLHQLQCNRPGGRMGLIRIFHCPDPSPERPPCPATTAWPPSLTWTRCTRTACPPLPCTLVNTNRARCYVSINRAAGFESRAISIIAFRFPCQSWRPSPSISRFARPARHNAALERQLRGITRRRRWLHQVPATGSEAEIQLTHYSGLRLLRNGLNSATPATAALGQMWIARPATARAASLTASFKVG